MAIDSVLITVFGSQRNEQGEENNIKLVTPGRRYMKNGVFYITYQETEVSGMDGATTLLKIYKDHVILVRTGAVEQRQEFRVGYRSISRYNTPYGVLDMGVRTTKLTVTRTQGQEYVTGIDIDYELEIDGQWQSANKLIITVQGDRKNGH